MLYEIILDYGQRARHPVLVKEKVRKQWMMIFVRVLLNSWL